MDIYRRLEEDLEKANFLFWYERLHLVSSFGFRILSEGWEFVKIVHLQKAVIVLIALACLTATVGCSGIFDKCKGVIGKAVRAENKARNEIDRVDEAVAKVDGERLTKIGSFASGVDYALKKDTQQSQSVIAATTLNERVMALSNKPDFSEVLSVKGMVDQLIANQDAGKAALNKKDTEITRLSASLYNLQSEKADAIDKYKQLAVVAAAKEDQYKSTLNQMDSFLGLGAVWYGIKRFVLHGLAWGIGFMVLFIVLRFASMSNPIAASIFAIFNQFGSWLIHGIAALFPKALSIAGNTATSVYNEYKSTMSKLVDAIQMANTIASAAGREPTLKDVLNEASKGMDTKEKAIIENIKKSLGWE